MPVVSHSDEAGVGMLGLVILLAVLGAIAYWAWQASSRPAYPSNTSSEPSLTAPVNQAKDSVNSVEQKNNNTSPYYEVSNV